MVVTEVDSRAKRPQPRTNLNNLLYHDCASFGNPPQVDNPSQPPANLNHSHPVCVWHQRTIERGGTTLSVSIGSLYPF